MLKHPALMVDAAAELLPIAAVDNNMSSPRAEDEDEYEASPDSGMDEQPTRFPATMVNICESPMMRRCLPHC
jgi:hypothetical protein